MFCGVVLKLVRSNYEIAFLVHERQLDSYACVSVTPSFQRGEVPG